MLSMHERRKSASSASVIWYIVSFGQFRTDRPYGILSLVDGVLAHVIIKALIMRPDRAGVARTFIATRRLKAAAVSIQLMRHESGSKDFYRDQAFEACLLLFNSKVVHG